jgi:hypothetical protein
MPRDLPGSQPSFSRITTRAASSYENLLTEVLALCIRLDREIAHGLFKRWTGGNPRGSVEVVTQRIARGGRKDRVDLALADDVCECWIEVKKDSREGDHQLEKYAHALKESDRTRRVLVYLTRPGQATEPIEKLRAKGLDTFGLDAAQPYDWQELGDWLKHTRFEDTEAGAPQLGALLFSFLQHEGVYADPMRADYEDAYRHFQAARSSLFSLTGRAADRLAEDGRWQELGRYPKSPHRWNDFPRTFLNYRIEDRAADEPEIILEWHFIADGSEERGSEGPSPVFVGAGLTLVGSRSWDDWKTESVRRLEDAGFDQIDIEGHLRLFSRMHYAELLKVGDSIDTQSQALATWIAEQFLEALKRGLPVPADATA